MKPSNQTHPYPMPSQGYPTPHTALNGQGQQQYTAGQPPNYGSVGQSYQLPQQQQQDLEPVGVGEMPMDDGKSVGEPEQPMPTAPPIQNMQKIAGYEKILAPDVAYIPPPPSYQEATSGTSIEQIASTVRLSEGEARDLLIGLAKSNCCWGKGAAEGMTIKNLQQNTAVHYALTTFLETRSTNWACEPFHGQMIDGPLNGRAPTPWEIQIQPPEMFQDVTYQTEVPHTASLRPCHGCQGSANLMCHRCKGWGRKRCSWCYGTGLQRRMYPCGSCDGVGKVRCKYCYGRGALPCPTCRATGQIKYFVQMTIVFTTHVNEFILERTPLPDHLVRGVPSMVLFEDTQPMLNPIKTFPDPQVNAQSASLIQEHRGLAQTGRIWMQNHVIRGVPVFQCDCKWKDKEFQFFVYGENREVYIENYPQACCWGCQLL